MKKRALIVDDEPLIRQLFQAILPFEQSCASKRSITSLNNMVVYASPDGICSISGGQALTQTFVKVYKA